MRCAVALAVVLTGCGRIGFDAIPGGDGGVDAMIAGFTHRKAMRIRTPVLSTQLDVPIFVGIGSDPDIAARPGDVVFGDAAGAPLPTERVAFDPLTGALDAWVAVPTLTGNVETTIYLYYGGPPSPLVSPWTHARHAGVWHMTLDGDQLKDSARGHDLTPPATTRVPVRAVGPSGAAAGYDGIDDAMVAPDPPDGSLDFSTGSFSYSLWVRARAAVGAFDTPFHKGGSGLGAGGYDLELGSTTWKASLSDATGLLDGYLGDEGDLVGSWHQLAIIVDRQAGQIRSVVDGALVSQQTLGAFGSVDTMDPLMIGRTTNVFAGEIDEVRIYRGAITVDWFAIEYANLLAPDFVIFGPEEAVPGL